MQRNLDEIIELLRKNYEKAKKSKYVQRPLAWALYQTWKTVDRVIDVQPTADVTDMNAYELTAEVMPGEGLAGRLLELAGGRPRTEDDENEEDVVGALKEMYGGDADGGQ